MIREIKKATSQLCKVLAIAIIAIFVAFGFSSIATAKTTTLTFVCTPSPREHTNVKGMFRFKELVEKRTNGAVKVEIYHSGELVKSARAEIAGVTAGTLGIASITNPGLATIEPRFSVLNMPYLFRDRKHADEVFDSKVIQDIVDDLENKGAIALTGYNETWRHIFNSKRPIFTPEDMKGLKLRTMESPVNVAIMNAMGANATPMAWGEVYLSLQNKTIDGLAIQINPVYTNSFFETGKYLSLTGASMQQFWYIMNLKQFKSLPTQYQKILLDSAKEAGRYSSELTVESEVQMVGELILKHNMSVNNLYDRQAFVKATKVVYEQSKDKYPPKMIRAIKAVGK